MVDGRTRPWQRDNREHESTLGEYRIAKGLTIKELCEQADTNPAYYERLHSGEMAPIFITKRRYGEPKPAAIRLSEVLGVDFEDLFPRYFCKIGSRTLLNSQVLEMSHSKNMETVEDFILAEHVKEILRRLPERESKVLIWRYYHGYTYAEIGDKLTVTRARVHQIIGRAIRKLRHPTRLSRMLLPFMVDRY